MNTYAYVDGNPLSKIDPDGLKGFCLNFDASYFVGVGGSVGGGLYYSTDTKDFGSYTYTAKGVGMSVGVTGSLVYFNGQGTSNLAGKSTAVTGSVFVASGSYSTSDGNVISGGPGLTVGPEAAMAGVSVATANTQVFSITQAMKNMAASAKHAIERLKPCGCK